METRFSPEQLEDPDIASCEAELRRCVHCGFCTATCPTYVLLGDELDSPRGRIYLIKNLLEDDARPGEAFVRHIDRCLSCLSCNTTCPSEVNYMHLVDEARARIARGYRRPLRDRVLRAVLAQALPRRTLFAHLVSLARGLRPLLRLPARLISPDAGPRMLNMLPARGPVAGAWPRPPASSRGHVALLQGCVEPALAPDIQPAAARLLARAGYTPVRIEGEGCCGALEHHLGHEERARTRARHNIALWTRAIREHGLEAIIATASGCTTTLLNYAHLLRDDPEYAAAARDVVERVVDLSSFLARVGLPPVTWTSAPKVAWQSPCSLQHGQKVRSAPLQLLRAAGCEVVEPAEAHLCCGSAGTYNLTQPELADRLRARKLENLRALDADLIVSANIGCMTHLGADDAVEVTHIATLLDRATA